MLACPPRVCGVCAHPCTVCVCVFQVIGQDSVFSVLYRGKVYWFWGDTNRPSAILGNFGTTAATSLLPSDGGLDPSVGVNLDYFDLPSGFVTVGEGQACVWRSQRVCADAVVTQNVTSISGPGPTWVGCVTALPQSESGALYAHYMKVGNKDGSDSSWGLLRWSDAQSRFVQVREFPPNSVFRNTPTNGAHTFVHADEATGHLYVYFSAPFPFVRALATPEGMADVENWEGYTPLQAGSTIADGQVVRNTNGELVYAWRKNTEPVFQSGQETLISNGAMQPEEAAIQLRSATSTNCVQPVLARGDTQYNPWRGKYIMIGCEANGDSPDGEVWFVEADKPEGPWTNAVKIITHATTQTSFYNPAFHTMFNEAGGEVVYLSGTFSAMWSFGAVPVPRCVTLCPACLHVRALTATLLLHSGTSTTT